ncbi:hypothetical protein EDD16DRAFT_189237 [Pisolithus croceorrhizus]|nr:hypothetical protein EDD16DRAFT_189237 [Pisolithus croceorrhizus]
MGPRGPTLTRNLNKKFPNSWEDITVSFEFKKGTRGNSDSKDDDKKVIWSLHHIMRSDPCHRATFGVTIESTEMKFWFTCRAVTIVSKPFNFFAISDHVGPYAVCLRPSKQEPEYLIYFFCSLVFAEDHQLGWDPTIQRVCVGGKIRYDISVCTDEGEVVYQTTRIIFDYSVDALIGRGFSTTTSIRRAASRHQVR